MNKVVWVLEYDFHLYTITFEEKGVEKRVEYFDKVEDLIATYREKKDALFAGCITYNSNFKIYKAECEETDPMMIEALL